MLESEFQAKLIKELEELFPYPTLLVMKNDANYRQGFPDLTLLFDNGWWAVLETKRRPNSKRRPNQPYYIDLLKETGGYAEYVQPENKNEVLNDLQQAYRSFRFTRCPQSI